MGFRGSRVQIPPSRLSKAMSVNQLGWLAFLLPDSLSQFGVRKSSTVKIASHDTLHRLRSISARRAKDIESNLNRAQCLTTVHDAQRFCNVASGV